MNDSDMNEDVWDEMYTLGAGDYWDTMQVWQHEYHLDCSMIVTIMLQETIRYCKMMGMSKKDLDGILHASLECFDGLDSPVGVARGSAAEQDMLQMLDTPKGKPKKPWMK